MMIRSGLYHLSTRTTTSSAATAVLPQQPVLLSVMRPVVVSLSSGRRWFSMNPKHNKHHIMKSFSSAEHDDESDSIEAGKQEQHLADEENKPVATSSRYNGPVYRPLFRGFDDDFFAPSFSMLRHNDPFGGAFRRNPFFKDLFHPPIHHRTLGDPSKTTLLRASPGYKIQESDTGYEIVVDIPEGMTKSDMEVHLSADQNMIRLQGERKTEQDGKVYQTRFDKHFSIGSNVDTENITANFHDGVLVVKAPKLQPTPLSEPEQPPPMKAIPITEEVLRQISDEEVAQKSFSDAFDESDWLEAGKARA